MLLMPDASTFQAVAVAFQRGLAARMFCDVLMPDGLALIRAALPSVSPSAPPTGFQS